MLDLSFITCSLFIAVCTDTAVRYDSEVQQGWDFATKIMGADLAAHMGMEYVSVVETAIKQLEDNINNHQYRNLGINQFQGYMLEE